jgi:hypothetical protein
MRRELRWVRAQGLCDAVANRNACVGQLASGQQRRHDVREEQVAQIVAVEGAEERRRGILKPCWKSVPRDQAFDGRKFRACRRAPRAGEACVGAKIFTRAPRQSSDNSVRPVRIAIKCRATHAPGASQASGCAGIDFPSSFFIRPAT